MSFVEGLCLNKVNEMQTMTSVAMRATLLVSPVSLFPLLGWSKDVLNIKHKNQHNCFHMNYSHSGSCVCKLT